MAKRKITVTVDEDLVELARRLGVETLSGVVNEALAAHLERLARRAALRQLLEDIVDAHVVAVCAFHGGGIVVTADSDDVERLAQAVPSARIVTRSV
ncbi:MAG: type II toxin-antitoxin system CcdA family antitoxin [Actinomycetota bacterium]